MCKDVKPKAPANSKIDPEQPKTVLQPFELVGLDMFSWKGDKYLIIVDRISSYIMVENFNCPALGSIQILRNHILAPSWPPPPPSNQM